MPGGDNPFPGRGLARCWSDRGPVRTDPVLSQVEEPRLTGEDFGNDQAVKINSVIDENYILIDSRSDPTELYAIEDRKQERNLAGDPSQRSRLERMRYDIGDSPRSTRSSVKSSLAPTPAALSVRPGAMVVPLDGVVESPSSGGIAKSRSGPPRTPTRPPGRRSNRSDPDRFGKWY